MRIYVAHSSEWDFIQKLYNPIKESRLFKEHEVIFPHDKANKNISTKEIIKESDLVIAEVSLPSTGEGIELGFASDFNVPILAIYEKGQKYSSAVKFITKDMIEYNNKEDMVTKIEKFIEKLV